MCQLCADKALHDTSPADRLPNFVDAGTGAAFRRHCSRLSIARTRGCCYIPAVIFSQSAVQQAQALLYKRRPHQKYRIRGRAPDKRGAWENEKEVQVHRKDFSCLATCKMQS